MSRQEADGRGGSGLSGGVAKADLSYSETDGKGRGVLCRRRIVRILITGAGQGLGCHIAAAALARGNKVLAAVHSLPRVSEEMQGLQGRYREKIEVFEMDVSDEESVRKARKMLQGQGKALDGIVNNAAIMVEREKTIEDLDLSAMRSSFEVNTIGPMRVVQQFLPMLYRGNKQVIVNISSEAGTIINAFATNYPYSMSKTALNMFSERLREHLREKDIRVYAVHPGWMRTNMGGVDAPADPRDIAAGIVDILERKKKIYSKIAFIDSTGRPMPL